MSLSDLIARVGEPVGAFGTLEHQDELHATLWVTRAWEPTHPRRAVGGSVAVTFAESTPASTGFVRIHGTWDGGAIADARATRTEQPRTVRWRAPDRTVRPRDLGPEGHATLSAEFLARSTPPPFSSGGTDDALWYHVLYVTPETVDAHRAFPCRVDIFVAVTPLSSP